MEITKAYWTFLNNEGEEGSPALVKEKGRLSFDVPPEPTALPITVIAPMGKGVMS
jgi:hypothetical protein